MTLYHKYQLPDDLLKLAISLREEGKTYTEIEQIFLAYGYKDEYGRPYRNALISANVVNSSEGQHLRVNKRGSKKSKPKRGRPKGSKNKIAPIVSVQTEKKAVNTQASQIHFLESKGFNPSQILAILKQC